jgi:hypothetical protein
MIMRKVDFFIVGAPKAGTTSLAEYLKAHPLIDFCKEKEPHFFSSDFKGLMSLHNINSFDVYHSLYGDADNKLRGEASTTYIFSKVAVNNIIKYNPSAKFIAMIRNPLELVRSFHAQKYKECMEDEPDFEVAWRKQALRMRGIGIPMFCTDLEFLLYKEWGLLGKQIERLFRMVPEGQRLVVCFDDLVRDPRSVYLEVLDFLGLPDDGRTDFSVHNAYQPVVKPYLNKLRVAVNRFRSANPALRTFHAILVRLMRSPDGGIGFQKFLQRIVFANGEKPPLSPDLRRELLEEFHDDICLLEKLIGLDLSSWKH